MAENEKFTISGSELVDKVKELIHQGNVRRVRLIHKEKALLDIPLTIGAPASAVVVLSAPVLAAVAAIAAMVTECTIEVEKVEDNVSPPQNSLSKQSWNLRQEKATSNNTSYVPPPHHNKPILKILD